MRQHAENTRGDTLEGGNEPEVKIAPKAATKNVIEFSENSTILVTLVYLDGKVVSCNLVPGYLTATTINMCSLQIIPEYVR